MDLREIYEQLEGSYDTMIRRLKRESMIQMFLADFLEDEEFLKLETALNEANDSAAFDAAHTLKGVVLNMEFGFLSKSVSDLTESLRGGRKPEADALFAKVKDDYNKTVSIIKQIV